MISVRDYQDLLRSDLVSFIERSFYELNPQTPLHIAPYIEVMAAMLDACRRGDTRRLIINLPPRYLKSHCASIAFVAWLLGHHPTYQIICASYGQDLADKLALDCRKLMLASWYQDLFRTRLAPEKQATNDFMTTARGGRMSTSVGGVLTGRGADIIILDDPLKPEDALSETKRNAVNAWYDSTLLSRLNDKNRGIIILIMQRLHQDDLVGHVLGQDDWTVLSFSAIAEVDERYPYRSGMGECWFERKAGEPLHEARESLDLLEKTKARIGDYNYASQYQQNPIPVGGAIIKSHWLQYYDEPPVPENISYILQSWDTAIKTGDINDYSVCTTWAVSKDKYYLLHVYRKRLNYPELKRAVWELSEQYQPKTILIEDKGSGSSLLQDLQTAGEYRVKPYLPPAGMDKLMRLYAQSGLFENGLVYLPTQAPWLHDYRMELIGFPGSKHDDQVDSTTQALGFLKTNVTKRLSVWEKLGRP